MGLHRFGELDPTVVVVVKATAAASWLRTVGLSNRPWPASVTALSVGERAKG